MYQHFIAVSAEHKMLYTTNERVLFFCWHKSFHRYRANLLYRTACSYLLFNLTRFILCVLERSIQTVLMFSQSQFKNNYMFRSQQTVNTTFQNNIKMQYTSIEHIHLLVCWIRTVYSIWSFSSWQLHNCSVPRSNMCTGKVKVLGNYDKTFGWCMGNGIATVGT
jgi:hypothetical protein